jgi:hypothetical protein
LTEGPPTGEDLDTATGIYSAGQGMPGYDFTELTFYKHSSGQVIRKKKSAHIDRDDGQRTNYHWLRVEEADQEIEPLRQSLEYSEDWPQQPDSQGPGADWGALRSLCHYRWRMSHRLGCQPKL